MKVKSVLKHMCYDQQIRIEGQSGTWWVNTTVENDHVWYKFAECEITTICTGVFQDTPAIVIYVKEGKEK